MRAAGIVWLNTAISSRWRTGRSRHGVACCAKSRHARARAPAPVRALARAPAGAGPWRDSFPATEARNEEPRRALDNDRSVALGAGHVDVGTGPGTRLPRPRDRRRPVRGRADRGHRLSLRRQGGRGRRRARRGARRLQRRLAALGLRVAESRRPGRVRRLLVRAGGFGRGRGRAQGRRPSVRSLGEPRPRRRRDHLRLRAATAQRDPSRREAGRGGAAGRTSGPVPPGCERGRPHDHAGVVLRALAAFGAGRRVPAGRTDEDRLLRGRELGGRGHRSGRQVAARQPEGSERRDRHPPARRAGSRRSRDGRRQHPRRTAIRGPPQPPEHHHQPRGDQQDAGLRGAAAARGAGALLDGAGDSTLRHPQRRGRAVRGEHRGGRLDRASPDRPGNRRLRGDVGRESSPASPTFRTPPRSRRAFVR